MRSWGCFRGARDAIGWEVSRAGSKRGLSTSAAWLLGASSAFFLFVSLCPFACTTKAAQIYSLLIRMPFTFPTHAHRDKFAWPRNVFAPTAARRWRASFCASLLPLPQTDTPLSMSTGTQQRGRHTSPQAAPPLPARRPLSLFLLFGEQNRPLHFPFPALRHFPSAVPLE